MGMKLHLSREEHKTGHGVPGGILGPKRDEAVGSWRKIQNQELQNLQSSPLFLLVSLFKSVFFHSLYFHLEMV
jgi:hypothetical protein